MNGQDDDHAGHQGQLSEARVLELWQYLFPIVLGWTSDGSHACDIVQEAICRYLTLLKTPERSNLIRNVNGYLIRVAHNFYVDELRQKDKFNLISLDHPTHDESSDVLSDELASSYDVYKEIEKADELDKLYSKVPLKMFFSELSQEEIDLLYLHKVDGMSPRVIAGQRGESPETVRYCLQKIEGKIRYRAKQYLKTSGKKSLF